MLVYTKMQQYNADLHIHSPHSIAVSQNIDLESLYRTCKQKGLSILGTGDITQPDWRNYLKENLSYEDGIYKYKDLAFIVQTELEDSDSIHHVVLLPDFKAAEELQKALSPKVKNITGKWAGRPHAHIGPAEIVEMVEDVGGICGPAHAFTPFKAVFRQGRYATLEEAYGTAAKKLAFLELGLSADTDLADRMESLKDITYLSNSDAHSEKAYSLGREFNRILLEKPTFDEIKMAMFRRKGRKVVLNVGMDPHLGKYHVMFCNKCRRRVKKSIATKGVKNEWQQYPPSQQAKGGLSKFVEEVNASNDAEGLNKSFSYKVQFDDDFLQYTFSRENDWSNFLYHAEQKDVECVACKSKIQSKKEKSKRTRKIPHLRLGVSERINQIATWDEPRYPEHRPKYIDIIPLIDILRKIKGIKSKNSKTVNRAFEKAVSEYGTEYEILVDMNTEKFSNFLDGKLSEIIDAFRNKKIKYISGGGGTFGSIQL